MSPSQYILISSTLLAAMGMWLMLPRGATRGRLLGVVLAVISLGLGISLMPRLGEWIAESTFALMALVAVVSATCAVTFRNPIYCAIWFGLTLLSIAGLFLLVNAQFLAVATIVVYAGAILVTLLFVLMLAQPEGKATYDSVSWDALLSASVGMIIVGILSATIGGVLNSPVLSESQAIRNISPTELSQGVLSPYHVANVGMELFGRYLIAIEVIGTLLFAALVGAAVIVAHAKNISINKTKEIT